MIDKLEAIRERFNEVSQQISQPEIVSDIRKFTALSKEYKELERVVVQYRAYENLLAN
ncbi:MAG: PCRF domain-containing protein, partial [Cytophagaceae bacterium]|nr:PCRF domain-containing protein [Cytophagaceae bacterium]